MTDISKAVISEIAIATQSTVVEKYGKNSALLKRADKSAMINIKGRSLIIAAFIDGAEDEIYDLTHPNSLNHAILRLKELLSKDKNTFVGEIIECWFISLLIVSSIAGIAALILASAS